MVNMKCELCGSIWTKDDSYRGMEIKCPNCQGACKCLISDEEKQECFECSVCGLICPPGSVKCPACGGEVVVEEECAQDLKFAFRAVIERGLVSRCGLCYNVLISNGHIGGSS